MPINTRRFRPITPEIIQAFRVTARKFEAARCRHQKTDGFRDFERTGSAWERLALLMRSIGAEVVILGGRVYISSLAIGTGGQPTDDWSCLALPGSLFVNLDAVAEGRSN